MALAQQPAQPQTPPLTQTAAAAPATKTTPDYPDPRTLTFGAYYWYTFPNNGPDLHTGKQASSFSDLLNLGKDKSNIYLEASFPITRTGELKFDAFRLVGSAYQVASKDTAPFDTQFYKGDGMSLTNRVQGMRFYLDDLLYPHKFPVAKLRFKSLWAVRYLAIRGTDYAPLQKDSAGNIVGAYATGSHQIVLPEFGAAMEYALAPHVLFRVEGAGMGFHSYVWDGAATLSVRHNRLEFVGGIKAVGYKTSPNQKQYFRGIVDGALVGIRYHFQ
jgi:hypothetical protein